VSPGGKPTALVTGASYGIGLELARCFAAGGHDLVLVARSTEKLQTLAAELRSQHRVTARCITADLSTPESPRQIIDALKADSIEIDVLVNNAGFGNHGKFWENALSSELGLLQVNVVALVHLTHLLLPGMVNRRRGRILNVASMAAFQPGPLMANYYASKAYVLSFSQALSNELAGTGVTVTALCPGPVATEFQKRAGIENSRLFNAAGMSAREVAEIGYTATMAGRRVSIAGLKNRLLAFSTRFMPTSPLLKFVRKLNESR
jgi:short-subunit dehydrogenase